MNNKREKKKNGKFLPAFLTSLMLANIGIPSFAATEIFAGGQDGFGAQINDLGGANINKNTGSEAQLGITGNGNTIKWDHLNVGAGNKLDFNFTQSGQVAVNKVINGVSKFAGTVSTSGENGHLVISNPNGMVFMDGSITNVDAGSATFTTHDVTWDGQKNGKIMTNSNGTDKGIIIGTGNGPVPVIKVCNDLNIIAPGIDVSGADLFAGGTVRMVSADGVNFVATPTAPNFNTTSNSNIAANNVQYARVGPNGETNYTSGNRGAINVGNTVVKKAVNSASVDGHLYLYANDGIFADNLKTGSVDMTSKNAFIGITNSNVEGNARSTLTAANSIDADNLSIKNADIESGSVTYVANSSFTDTQITSGDAMIAYNSLFSSSSSMAGNGHGFIHTSGVIAENSTFDAGNIITDGSQYFNSKLNASEYMSAQNSNFDNTTVYAGDIHILASTSHYSNFDVNSNINIYNSNFYDTNLRAGNDINITDWSVMNQVNANANNRIAVNYGSEIQDGILEATNIDIDSSTIRGAMMYARDNIRLSGGSHLDRVFANADNAIISYSNEFIRHSDLFANDIFLQSSIVEFSSLQARNDVNISGSSYLYGTRIGTDTGDIRIYQGAQIQDLSLISGRDIEIQDSNIGTIDAHANERIFLWYNDAINGAHKFFDANNIHIIGGVYDNLVANAYSNIDIEGSMVNNATIWANDAINVRNHSNIENSWLASNNHIFIGDGWSPGYLKNSVAQAADIEINGSIIEGGGLYASRDINISNWSTIDGVRVYADGKIAAHGADTIQYSELNAQDIDLNSSMVKGSALFARNNITSNGWSLFADSKFGTEYGDIAINNRAELYGMYLDSGKDIQINGSYLHSVDANAKGHIGLHVVDASGNDHKNFNANDVTMIGGVFEGTLVNAANNVDIIGAGIYNGSKIDAGNKIDVTYGANIQDSNLTAQNDISIDGSDCALYLKNVIANAVNGDIKIKNPGRGHGLGVESTKLIAGSNIDISGSQLTNMQQMDAGNSIIIENSSAYGDIIANAGNNINVNGLKSDSNIKLIANNTIDIKNTNAQKTILALNANNIVADTIKANLVYLGGRTKDKAQQSVTIDNPSWHEEWNPMASNIIANNIEADLDLRLLSTDKVIADNLTSGGDIRIMGNDVIASNINVADQKIKTHYPSPTTTTGLNVQTYDSWAKGWGLASNKGEDTKLTLNNVNIDNKSAMVEIDGFETVNAENINTPKFLLESVKTANVDGLTADEIHISNLYYTLFGQGYFDTENLNINDVKAFTQGNEVKVNKSFNPDEFDKNIDKNYGYKHNTLMLQYLNGDYGKVIGDADNTNIVPINYVDNVVLDDGKITIVTPIPPIHPIDNNNQTGTTDNNILNKSPKFAFDENFYKVDKDIDTIFRKRFTHKGFAATDEDIVEMKNEAASNVIKGETGLVKVMKEYRLY